jgi:hypothetical protein
MSLNLLKRFWLTLCSEWDAEAVSETRGSVTGHQLSMHPATDAFSISCIEIIPSVEACRTQKGNNKCFVISVKQVLLCELKKLTLMAPVHEF